MAASGVSCTSDCMFGCRAEAGSRPAGEVLFFASPKKSTQKKGDPQSATPSRCEGANLRRGGCGVRRGTHCAALQLRSDIHGESEHEARALRRACHPPNAPPQAQPAGGGQPNIQQPHNPFGPLLRSARAAQRVALAPARWGRAQRWPAWMFCSPCPSGCAEERRVWRIRARVCLSDAQRRELSETPLNPSTAGCPVAKRRGRRQWGRPFFGSFLSATRKKGTRTPGDSRPPPLTQAQSPIHPQAPTTSARYCRMQKKCY